MLATITSYQKTFLNVVLLIMVVIGNSMELLMLFYDGCLWRLRLITKIKSEYLKSSRTNHDVDTQCCTYEMRQTERERKVCDSHVYNVKHLACAKGGLMCIPKYESIFL